MEQLINIFQDLNYRELSILFWTPIFLIFIAILTKRKGSSKGKIKAIISSVTNKLGVVKLLLLMIYFIYIALITYLFYQINFWEITLLKETIVWTLFVGVFLLLKSPCVENPQELIKKFLYSSIAVIVILEFIIDLHVYSGWVEFAMIPFLSVLGFCDIVNRISLNNTDNVCGKILSFIGWTVFCIALYNVFINIQDVLTIDTAKSMVYPLILTVFTVPFVYVFVLFINYKKLFTSINNHGKGDKWIKRNIKIIIFKNCLFNLSKLIKINGLPNHYLYQIKTDDDLKDLKESYTGLL